MACYTEFFLIAFLYSIYLQLNVETLISLKNVLSKVYWIKNHSNHNWMQTQFLSTFYTPAEHYFLQGVWKMLNVLHTQLLQKHTKAMHQYFMHCDLKKAK